MLKRSLPALALITLLFACNKKTTEPCTLVDGHPNTTEIANIQTYLTSKGITATLDNRGFFYQIIGPGYGADFPTLASMVSVNYKGTLTDGTSFDSTVTGTPAVFPLSNLILGWQYGIPLVKKGGVINLYLPPSLGYGCVGSGAVPGNATTIFRIELVNY